MKKKSLFSILGAIILLFTCSCNSEEPVANDANAKADVSFELSFPESQTKADDPNFAVPCYDLKGLQDLANLGKLKLDFTLGTTAYSTKIVYANNKFIADPVALGIGTYAINEFIVKDNDGHILYAAPKTGSPLASYVPANYTLPFNLVVGENDIYKKTTRPIWVICAQHVTPQQFGYIMWDINFIKMLCLPFSINVCDDKGLHAIGAGSIKIYKDGSFTDSQFTEAGSSLFSSVDFPNGNKLAELCIPDILLIDNDKEFYKFVITTTKNGQPATYTGIANVTTLLNYQSSDAWDATNHYIHLDFCNCDPKWFFTCDKPIVDDCRLTWDVTFSEYKGKEQNLASLISVAKPPHQMNGSFPVYNFVNGLNGLTISSEGYVNIPAGYVIRFNGKVQQPTSQLLHANIFIMGYKYPSGTYITQPYHIDSNEPDFPNHLDAITPFSIFNNAPAGKYSLDCPSAGFNMPPRCYQPYFVFDKNVDYVSRMYLTSEHPLHITQVVGP